MRRSFEKQINKITQAINSIKPADILISLVLSIVLASVFIIFISGISFLGDSKFPRVNGEQYKVYEEDLSLAISISKEDTDEALRQLEAFPKLPRLLENRKNYILGTLYQERNNIAMAFTSFYKVEEDYLPRFSLWKLTKIAEKIGYERIVVKNLRYLVKKYPKDPKFLYELAKSYARQNSHEIARDLFREVQKKFPKSEYGIGANYYLGNLSGNEELRFDYFIKYLKASPEGRFASLISDQIIKKHKETKEYLAEEPPYILDDSIYEPLKDFIALSYFHNESWNEAVKYFSEDTPHWLEKTRALVKAKRFGEANSLMMKKIPEEDDVEKAKEAVEYLIAVNGRWTELDYLRKLLPEMTIIQDKILWHIAQITKSSSDYKKVYEKYPESFYAPESMARVFWKLYKAKSFEKALKLSDIHWQKYSHARSHSSVAFWSAKMLLERKDQAGAEKRFKSIIKAHPRDYYRFRSEAFLNGTKDWFKSKSVKFSTYPAWEWPAAYSEGEVKSKYSKEILELMKIQQFGEILSLEESENLELDDDFRMWLHALDGNHLKAISGAYFRIKPDEKIKRDLKHEFAFPLLYSEFIAGEASKLFKIDPLMAHALIKQESRYQPEIVSRAGAVGLMQLMPYTAKNVARRIRFRSPTLKDLRNPAINLPLGVAYMEEVFDRFDGNMIHAIASYNAGPNAVSKWIKTKPKDPDLFIEAIPYNETKGYVKHVLENYWIYRMLYEDLYKFERNAKS